MPDKQSQEQDLASLEQAYQDTSGFFDNYEKKILDQSNLLNIAGLINSTLDLEEMTTKLLYVCQGTILVSTISFFLKPSVMSTGYSLKSAVGLEQEGLVIELPETGPLVRRLADKTAGLTITELSGIPDYAQDLEILAPIEPVLLVPMKNKGNLTGIMAYGAKLDQTPFTNSEIDLVTRVAEFAAMAAENIRLFEMATMDRMTNLYIHHYFQNRLEEEVVRALRYGSPLSLIMLDIDHFKSVNDTYGHPAGDVVIKGIAGLVRENLRKNDLPARYGGEEFAIVLPQADIHQAEQVAQRIRKGVKASSFLTIGSKKLKVTISAGVCQLVTGKIQTRESLISGADTALYVSKREGRNRVSLYDPQ